MWPSLARRADDEAPRQFCLTKAAGRVGASAHFSVSEPRSFKRAPVVLITPSLGTLTHSTQHVAARESTTALEEGGKRQLHSSLGFSKALVTAGGNRIFGWPSRLFSIVV